MGSQCGLRDLAGPSMGQKLWQRGWSWDITYYLEEPLCQAAVPHNFREVETSCPRRSSALPKAVTLHCTWSPGARGWDKGRRWGSSHGHAHSGKGEAGKRVASRARQRARQAPLKPSFRLVLQRRG